MPRMGGDWESQEKLMDGTEHCTGDLSLLLEIEFNGDGARAGGLRGIPMKSSRKYPAIEGSREPGQIARDGLPRGRGQDGVSRQRRIMMTSMRYPLLLLVISFFVIVPISAAEVTFSTPHTEFYVLTGEEGSIPLTIASTYDHDVTGTLEMIMTVANSSGGEVSPAKSVQAREFAAFTGERTVTLSIGKSDSPGDLLLDINFDYAEGGGRTVALHGIIVHFVAGIEDTGEDSGPLVSTEMANPNAGQGQGQGGTAPTTNQQAGDPEAVLQNNQMAGDISALREQLAEEMNRSRMREDELLGYVMADPLIRSLVEPLEDAGFTVVETDITPVTNVSGDFLLTYASGREGAMIQGSLRDREVLVAEESSDALVPLPGALQDNTTYQEYGGRVAENGFVRSRTVMNATPDKMAVDLTYVNTQDRAIHLRATIINGTLTEIEGDNPDDPWSFAASFLPFMMVLLISAGIWYLARTWPDNPPHALEDSGESRSSMTHREAVLQLLDEASEDAAGGSYASAYRKTARALRVYLSHEAGDGRELTNDESERLIGCYAANREKIQTLFDGCRRVGFAKATPDPGELQEMIRFTRALVSEKSRDE